MSGLTSKLQANHLSDWQPGHSNLNAMAIKFSFRRNLFLTVCQQLVRVQTSKLSRFD